MTMKAMDPMRGRWSAGRFPAPMVYPVGEGIQPAMDEPATQRQGDDCGDEGQSDELA